jgi:hypothetical protein
MTDEQLEAFIAEEVELIAKNKANGPVTRN